MCMLNLQLQKTHQNFLGFTNLSEETYLPWEESEKFVVTFPQQQHSSKK